MTTSARDPLRRPPHPMTLLGQGVPLSLLLDLASPSGPDSRRVLVEEGRATVTWLPVLPARRRALRTRAAAG